MAKKSFLTKIRSFSRKVFSKTTLIFFILLLEISAIVALIILFMNSSIFPWLYIGCEIISIILMLYLTNSEMDINYRITWLLLVAILPAFGTIAYLLFANKKFSKKEIKKIMPGLTQLEKVLDDDRTNGVGKNLTPDDGDLFNFGHYLRNHSFTDVYKNTRTTYYPWGELGFPTMLEKLKSAKHYIFLEYFIIEPGKMWNSILNILIKKVNEGLDVRVMYDDLGCIGTLPSNYVKTLRKLGIKCKKYAKLRPFLDIRMNNRDHRKILVIDGHTGFTGGINLADEYINEVVRFGKWKDNCIMLEGDGVFGLTTLFIANWSMCTMNDKNYVHEDEDFEAFNFLPSKYSNEVPPIHNTSGYVQPYGSLPYIYETVGMNIYELLLLRAKKYVYISTPYLILNDNLRNAICQAAKNGVDVRILTPHIPDKKLVFSLTRANYKELVLSGCKVYEYTPGFVHEKVFVVDDCIATVGTINLDYRSLFLHCENGVFLYHCDCIKDIKQDFEDTFLVSTPYTEEDIKNTKTRTKLGRFLLKLIAPLL